MGFPCLYRGLGGANLLDLGHVTSLHGGWLVVEVTHSTAWRTPQCKEGSSDPKETNILKWVGQKKNIIKIEKEDRLEKHGGGGGTFLLGHRLAVPIGRVCSLPPLSVLSVLEKPADSSVLSSGSSPGCC